jgi:hypothetical protein
MLLSNEWLNNSVSAKERVYPGIISTILALYLLKLIWKIASSRIGVELWSGQWTHDMILASLDIMAGPLWCKEYRMSPN